MTAGFPVSPLRRLILGSWLMLFAAGHLSAAVFTIDDHDVAGLIAAINAANTNGVADAINLATNGTYTLTAADNASNGGNGLPVILNDALGPDLAIHGNGATIQRSANAPNFRFLQINAAVTLDNITFKNGSSTELGGAIRVSATANTSLTITSCNLTTNLATGGGGAIANVQNASVSITSCVLSHNDGGTSTAGQHSAGGAVLNQANGTVSITDCTINNNGSSGIDGGGGVANTGMGTVNVTNSTLDGNSSGFDSNGFLHNGAPGGGISNSGGGLVTLTGATLTHNGATTHGGGVANISGTLTATNSVLSENSATGFAQFSSFGEGGAISHQAGTMTITNCTLSGNQASFAGGDSNLGPAYGGGIYHLAALTITGSTISGNLARGAFAPQTGNPNVGFGGGIFSDGSLTATNCTITGNSAQGGAALSNQSPGAQGAGGGIYFGANVTSNITSCTIALNSATGGMGSPTAAGLGGGAFRVTGSVLVKSTIIAGNSAQTPDTDGSFTSKGFNLVGNPNGSSNSFTDPTDLFGTVNAPLDPKLDPNGLKNNGGPTQTIALLVGSPAIDKGTSAGPNGILPTDQRGLARTVDDPNIPNPGTENGTDIGAYELQTVGPTPTPTATPTPTPGSLGNVSTRLQVGTSDNVLFAGFFIQGSASKTVLIRSAGPSLTSFGVPGALGNPQLELHDAHNTIGTNDNWQTTQLGGVITSDQVAAIQNSGEAPRDPAEPAIIATLPAGGYTAIVQGGGGAQGVATVEVYDLSPNNGAILANISTRGFIQTGDNVMIGGFIVVGRSTSVLILATGPSLIPLGINNALTNPRLELHDVNGTLAANNDWQTTQLGGIIISDQSTAIQNTGLAPTNPAESGIIATLAPGNYTAIAQGVNSEIGVGLVQVFALP